MNINSSSLYGVSAYSSYSSTAITSSNSSAFAEALFGMMDADASGGVDTAEFSKAALELSNISDESALSEAFSGLDADEDGSISSDELASALEDMASQGMMAAGAPPPPPPGPPPSKSDEEDEGYTVDELTTLASETSSTDTNLASLFETLAANFDAADANGDGKVTSAEAMAYQDSSKEESMGVSEKKGEESFLKGMMAQLIASYASQNSTTQSSLNLSA